MENIIIIAILVLILGFAGWYVYKEKRKGNKCIGCPFADSCKSSCCDQKKKSSRRS
ncbi:MAG: FeoB-associated Cys-rich membrane protein [Clostridia bacterium]|nr:FeoB-associated Cys-rich membrane protein [Clostridia bacterium]